MIFVSLFTEEYQLKAAIFSNNSCPFVTGSIGEASWGNFAKKIV